MSLICVYTHEIMATIKIMNTLITLKVKTVFFKLQVATQ